MIHRRPQAILALIELAEYIGQDSPAAAERFLDSAESTFTDLERMPNVGRSYHSTDPRLANVRTWRVKGFRNHLIFYRPTDDGVEILTVVHGARDIPGVLEDEL